MQKWALVNFSRTGFPQCYCQMTIKICKFVNKKLDIYIFLQYYSLQTMV